MDDDTPPTLGLRALLIGGALAGILWAIGMAALMIAMIARH